MDKSKSVYDIVCEPPNHKSVYDIVCEPPNHKLNICKKCKNVYILLDEKNNNICYNCNNKKKRCITCILS